MQDTVVCNDKVNSLCACSPIDLRLPCKYQHNFVELSALKDLLW
jgi:hypothetical protein